MTTWIDISQSAVVIAWTYPAVDYYAPDGLHRPWTVTEMLEATGPMIRAPEMPGRRVFSRGRGCWFSRYHNGGEAAGYTAYVIRDDARELQPGREGS